MSLLYKECARIIALVINGKGSIKSLCLSTRNQAKTKVYAIVFNTLKNYETLQKIATAQSLESTPFVMVHLYELLYRGSLKTGGKLKCQLVKCLPELKELKKKYHTESDYRRLPLYARINTLKAADPVEIVKQLKETFPEVPFSGDSHVNFLLKFPPTTNFSNNSLYKSGKVILQDKASCLPAIVLNPPEGSTVLDACSAPGNKTLHLSAIMNNTGTIYAVEKDRKRFQRLQANVSKYGAKNIKGINKSFLDLDPKDYKSVTHVLLDPSCSGSGMVTQRVVRGTTSIDKNRLKQLSDLQKSLVSHALTFPSVTRIVYSTCSIHPEENEFVIKELLETHPGWELVTALPCWKRRGWDSVFGGADKCVRCTAEDETNGFFLACLVKKDTDKDFLGGFNIQKVFSVHHLNSRFKIKYHYKYPYKFLKL